MALASLSEDRTWNDSYWTRKELRVAMRFYRILREASMIQKKHFVMRLLRCKRALTICKTRLRRIAARFKEEKSRRVYYDTPNMEPDFLRAASSMLEQARDDELMSRSRRGLLGRIFPSDFFVHFDPEAPPAHPAPPRSKKTKPVDDQKQSPSPLVSS